MDTPLVLSALATLVAAATALGLAHRYLRGRVRRLSGVRSVKIPGLVLGRRATLLQFSSQVCAACPPTARILDRVSERTPGVTHVEIDITERPGLAAEFGLFQTPTTFLLDAAGSLRARFGGAIREELLADELGRVLGGSRPGPARSSALISPANSERTATR